MRPLFAFAALSLAAASAFAEPPTQLIGRVTDPATHQPVEGVTITVSGDIGQREVTTDENGLYRVVVPQAGTYSVTFAYGGQKTTSTLKIAEHAIATLDTTFGAANETIVIHDRVAPAVVPKPLKDPRIVPPYSDAAIQHDVWVKAWLLLDIDPTGHVTRVKLLKHPGYDLDKIALETALGLEFEPARDATGAAVRTLMVWPLEWPSHGWLIDRTGVATGRPDGSLPSYVGRYDIYNIRRQTRAEMLNAGNITDQVYCSTGPHGGPAKTDSIHPMQRDCSVPDLSKADAEPWVDAQALKTMK